MDKTIVNLQVLSDTNLGGGMNGWSQLAVGIATFMDAEYQL